MLLKSILSATTIAAVAVTALASGASARTLIIRDGGDVTIVRRVVEVPRPVIVERTCFIRKFVNFEGDLVIKRICD